MPDILNRPTLLGDVLVLDMADERGSFCSKLLADLGARVIKIEKPGGDPSRRTEASSFAYHNANKLGLTLDPDSPTDRKIFRRLVRKADALVETFETGYLGPRRLSFRSLRRLNPNLIHLSISGFGHTGPKRRFRSCDSVASASGGQTYVSGYPSGAPIKPPGTQSSYAASLFGAVAVLMALRGRHLTGRGRYIDLASQEAVASTLDHVMVEYFHGGTVARRKGSIYGNNFSSILPCKDGFIQITILQNWDTLLELMASEGKAEDLVREEWQEQTYRERHFLHLTDVVGRWTRKHTRSELFELGQAMHFPWASIDAPREVLRSPQLAARGFFVQTGLPGGTAIHPFPGLPYKFSSFSPVPPKAAPLPGEHNETLLAELAVGRRKPGRSYVNDNSRRLPAAEGSVLGGVRVLDFTWMLAGPFATRILADCGAEVIKVQSKRTAQGAEKNDSAHFTAWNRNKRSITLDLDHPEAREIVLELTSRSDVVVENFSSRVMAGWGFTYDRLKEVKPDLVMASISAMGRTGPWKDFVGFAPTFHALSGLVSAMSIGLDEPICLGHAYGDIVAGLYGALAIMVALRHRDATGVGQYIDLSAYEAGCTVLGPTLVDAAMKNRGGSVSGKEVFEGCYPCLGDDRWCVLSVSSDEEWQGFGRIIGLPEPGSDRFSTLAKARRNKATLDKAIGRWTMGHTAERIVDRLQKAGIAAAVVQNGEDLAKDRQLASRGFFISLPHPTLGKTLSDRTPLFCNTTETQSWKGAPSLGADNEYVFSDLLGMSVETIRSYREKGIIG